MIMNKNTNNVYLRCLPRGFTEQMLTDLCEPYGELTCTRLRESGIAFVRYRKPEDAQHAIRQLNGKRFPDHNETLLAKLANSDPFQPKIGFKPHNRFDDDGDSQNTMNSSDTSDGNKRGRYSNPPRRIRGGHHGQHGGHSEHGGHPQYVPNHHGSANGTPNHGRNRNPRNHPSTVSDDHLKQYLANGAVGNMNLSNIPNIHSSQHSQHGLHGHNQIINHLHTQQNVYQTAGQSVQSVQPSPGLSPQRQLQQQQAQGQSAVQQPQQLQYGQVQTQYAQEYRAQPANGQIQGLYAQDFSSNANQQHGSYGHATYGQVSQPQMQYQVNSQVNTQGNLNQVNQQQYGQYGQQQYGGYSLTHSSIPQQGQSVQTIQSVQQQVQGQVSQVQQGQTQVVQVPVTYTNPPYYTGYYYGSQPYGTAPQTPNVTLQPASSTGVTGVNATATPQPSLQPTQTSQQVQVQGQVPGPGQIQLPTGTTLQNTTSNGSALTGIPTTTPEVNVNVNSNPINALNPVDAMNATNADLATALRNAARANAGGTIAGNAETSPPTASGTIPKLTTTAAPIQIPTGTVTKVDKVGGTATKVATVGGAIPMETPTSNAGQVTPNVPFYLPMANGQFMAMNVMSSQMSPGPPPSISGISGFDPTAPYDHGSVISSIAGHAASDIIAQTSHLANLTKSTVAMPAVPTVAVPPHGQIQMNMDQLSPGVLQHQHYSGHALSGWTAAAIPTAVPYAQSLTPTPNAVLAQQLMSAVAKPNESGKGAGGTSATSNINAEQNGTAGGAGGVTTTTQTTATTVVSPSIEDATGQMKQLQIVTEVPANAAAGNNNDNVTSPPTGSSPTTATTTQVDSPGSDSNEKEKKNRLSAQQIMAKIKAGGFDHKMAENPKSVSRELSNQLHDAIKQWYPHRAGKLTGMFLQGHDEEKVAKYLRRPDKLRNKIATFDRLLDTADKGSAAAVAAAHNAGAAAASSSAGSSASSSSSSSGSD